MKSKETMALSINSPGTASWQFSECQCLGKRLRQSPKDAQDCVNTSVVIAEYLDRINQTNINKKLPKFKVRIGIFTGEVVAGSLGGKERMEYGVIGDSVNISSRLESCAKGRHPVDCRILIAGSTKKYLDKQFALEAWGTMPLKGKSEVIEVFRVLTPKEKGFLGIVSQTTF